MRNNTDVIDSQFLAIFRLTEKIRSANDSLMYWALVAECWSSMTWEKSNVPAIEQLKCDQKLMEIQQLILELESARAMLLKGKNSGPELTHRGVGEGDNGLGFDS